MQNKYEVIEVVGEGAYGIVYKCRNKETKEYVAIKKFKETEDELVKKTMKRELRVLQLLQHDNIVEFKDAFKRKGNLFLVFEYVERNLLELLEAKPTGLEPTLIKSLIYQLCKAVKYLHDLNIIHRDVKPENLLVSNTNKLKLCDFGFARKVNINKKENLTDYVATRWYRSPELLITNGYYGPEVDYWAIGCIMGELADGNPLFPGENETDQLHCIQKVLGNLPQEQIDIFYRNPLYSGKKLLDVEKPETLERRYMGKLPKIAISFMKGLLELDPKRRLNGKTVFSHPYFQGMDPGFNNKNINIITPNKGQITLSVEDKSTERSSVIVNPNTSIQFNNSNSNRDNNHNNNKDKGNYPPVQVSYTPSKNVDQTTYNTTNINIINYNYNNNNNTNNNGVNAVSQNQVKPMFKKIILTNTSTTGVNNSNNNNTNNKSNNNPPPNIHLINNNNNNTNSNSVMLGAIPKVGLMTLSNNFPKYLNNKNPMFKYMKTPIKGTPIKKEISPSSTSFNFTNKPKYNSPQIISLIPTKAPYATEGNRTFYQDTKNIYSQNQLRNTNYNSNIIYEDAEFTTSQSIQKNNNKYMNTGMHKVHIGFSNPQKSIKKKQMGHNAIMSYYNGNINKKGYFGGKYNFQLPSLGKVYRGQYHLQNSNNNGNSNNNNLVKTYYYPK
jgi:cyclin-dependent kinase-like